MRLLFVLSSLCVLCALSAPPTTYLELAGSSAQLKFAVQVCVGLFNRDDSVAGAAYTFNGARDAAWLECTGNNHSDSKRIALPNFLHRCLHGDSSTPAVAKGYLRYNYTTQKIIVPNIATIAGVLDAVPLDDIQIASLVLEKTPPLVDLVLTFPNTADVQNAPRVATQWVYDRYINQTTGMSKMNPGLDVHGKHKINPPLTGSPDTGLVDYIVKERLFNFFLNQGCIPLTHDHALMTTIAENNPWPKPITVYGYDDTFAVAGDLFEAETDCVNNLGQVASNGCSNLAFFSRKPQISEPLKQVPDPPSMLAEYNKSQTYVTVIIGDGDNVNFVKGSRFDWINQRRESCLKDPKHCAPLAWSLSPALLHLAPDWIRWYYAQAHSTGQDWFVLPPSGHSYSYPGEMSPSDQASFVHATEQDAHLMNLSGTVSWEFSATWGKAIKNFFPRFAPEGIVKACFAVNVPYPFPVLEFGKDEHYKILGAAQGEKMVLFAPREWRGNGTTPYPFGIGVKNQLSPQAMAAELNRYAKGTVSHIYTTSDGGFNLNQLSEMIEHLDEHVKLVSPNEIAMRALQRG